MNSQYFALAPTSEIANEIQAKWSDHERWLSDSDYGRLVQNYYDQYYGLKDGGLDVDISSNGTDAHVGVNHFKSLLQRTHSITTQSKLNYQPRATNSDAESQMQSDLTRGLLEYYGDEKNMNGVVSDMVEVGLLALDAYVFAPWDEHEGELVRKKPDTLEEIRTGDQAFHVLTRFDVATHSELAKSPYHIVKLRRNKYDLAALHPDKAEYILSLSSAAPQLDHAYLQTPFNTQVQLASDDVVDVLYFFHDRTPALPKGRYTVVVGTEVLKDVALPYKTVPVVRFCPAKMHATTSGDSTAKILYGPQKAIDNIYSSNLTNNMHYNKQSIWSKTAIQIEKLSEGYNNVISPEKPEALQLTNSSPESYKLLQGFEAIMGTLSGINNTTRGNPEASLKSGTSLALMLSISIMSTDSVQKAYVQACSELATVVVHNLQTFASEPRIAYIGGVSKRAFAKEFKNSDIAAIDRVSIDVGNPLLSNLGGRYELVQQWLQYGALKDPVKIIEFLRTGQLDSLTEDAFKNGILIRLENEELRKGNNPKVMMTDHHDQHIMEHAQLSNDPVIRSNPKIMEANTAHIMEHIRQRKRMDPDLAAILGLQPLPSQVQQMQQAPTPGEQEAGPAGDAEMTRALPEVPPLPENAPDEAQLAYDEAQAQMPPELQ